MRGRTVTNVTSAPISAASSTPSSTAAQAPSDPSVAITIRFIGCSFHWDRFSTRAGSGSSWPWPSLDQGFAAGGSAAGRMAVSVTISHTCPMAAAASDVRDVILRTGGTLRLRPPVADDADAVLAFLGRLSEQSVYRRFHGFPALR